MPRVVTIRALAFCASTVILLAACSSSSDTSSSSQAPSSTKAPKTKIERARPVGPKADLTRELTGGKGVFVATPYGNQLEGTDYVEREYEAAGTATAYKATAQPEDGRWSLTPANSAPYRSRIVVRRPAKPADFNGTVVMEWLNVSGGADADPEWTNTHEEIVRSGAIWVGVSAQQLGIMGGKVLVSVPSAADTESAAGKGLRKLDPARYGELQHPGDGYSYDIFTQVARALRDGGAPLGGMIPERVIGAGQSQSAAAMVSYINGVQPLTHAFDGFFVHSRGGSGLQIDSGASTADMAGTIGRTRTILRTDTTVPIMNIQTEGDIIGVLNSFAARQPDNDHFRLWEVAGTAHADRTVMGATADIVECGLPVNDGPFHIVAKAAFHSLDEWIRDGTAPPKADRIEIADPEQRAAKRDADGIAVGGIRTPPIDVPAVVLSGLPGPSPEVICILDGSTRPLSAARLAQLYTSRADYEARYNADIDRAVKAGFVLDADRQALLRYAQPDKIAG